jgi:hypothetical protein
METPGWRHEVALGRGCKPSDYGRLAAAHRRGVAAPGRESGLAPPVAARVLFDSRRRHVAVLARALANADEHAGAV